MPCLDPMYLNQSYISLFHFFGEQPGVGDDEKEPLALHCDPDLGHVPQDAPAAHQNCHNCLCCRLG